MRQVTVPSNGEKRWRLEALAKRARRSKSFLAAEAIAAFVELEGSPRRQSWPRRRPKVAIGKHFLNRKHQKPQEARRVTRLRLVRWLLALMRITMARRLPVDLAQNIMTKLAGRPCPSR